MGESIFRMIRRLKSRVIQSFKFSCDCLGFGIFISFVIAKDTRSKDNESSISECYTPSSQPFSTYRKLCINPEDSALLQWPICFTHNNLPILNAIPLNSVTFAGRLPAFKNYSGKKRFQIHCQETQARNVRLLPIMCFLTTGVRVSGLNCMLRKEWQVCALWPLSCLSW
jgi:hypothetical protein